jgi:hypothetical protein
MAGKHEEARPEDAEDLALVYLGRLDEETMTLAWGSDRSFEDRRRVVAAAVIFGHKFEERMADSPPESLDDAHFQRFLMGLMNAAIDEFAAAEGLDPATAAAFLGDVGTRDLIFEFSDVLDRFAEEPEIPLDHHLRAAVEGRQDRAVWSHHWRGGHRG